MQTINAGIFGNTGTIIAGTFANAGISDNKRIGNYDGERANLIVSCTDTVISRVFISDRFNKDYNANYRPPYEIPLYWIDFGNTQHSGQVIIGSKTISQPNSKKYNVVDKLKTVTELFDYSTLKDNDTIPSCSLVEALKKQDLFINSSLATFGCDILWRMFREGFIDYQGCFLNLKTGKMNRVRI